jgi:hypothetical protein
MFRNRHHVRIIEKQKEMKDHGFALKRLTVEDKKPLHEHVTVTQPCATGNVQHSDAHTSQL